MKASVKLITPQAATKLLENNDHNRALSDHIVTRYAKIMRNGGWQLNGDPVRIDTEGRLLDGQHRLQAIIRTGMSQQILIVENLAPDCFKTIDTGKIRTLSDILSIEGQGKYRVLKASGIRFIYGLASGKEADKIQGGSKLEHPEALEFASNLKGFYGSMEELGKLTMAITLLSSQAAATLYYLFGLVSTRQRNEFFYSLDSGADMAKKHPVLALRNKLISMRADGKSLRCNEVLPYAISAWKSYRKEIEVGYLKSTTDCSLEAIVGKRNAEFLQELAKVNKE